MDPAAAPARRRRPWFPRTRGDGPPAGMLVSWSPGVSPHTRGWTRGRAVLHGRTQGFPAHAGMDPASSRTRAWSVWFPRTRGDGPSAAPRAAAPTWVSPHTRGWTVDDARGAGRDDGFPAHAGMDPAGSSWPLASRWFPRTRGDGPRRLRQAGQQRQVSPHTRGWTRLPRPGITTLAGFPAHAGMDPWRLRPATSRTRFPRTRGDGPVAVRPFPPAQEVSPHTRGWTRPGRQHRGSRRGFPAHAGMDPVAMRLVAVTTGFPRTRGDGPSMSSACRWTSRVSPHTRGWTRRASRSRSSTMGFPAHAGMDPRALRARSRIAAVSPHTRGWTLDHDRGELPGGGFPAHAGMDPRPATRPPCSRRFPRTRGDGPCPPRGHAELGEVSPHTRGWTEAPHHPRPRRRGFPAHAGMDLGRAASCPASRRFPRTRGDGPPVQEGALYLLRVPRTRGDGPVSGAKSAPRPVVSPHTRGWTRHCRS